MVVPQNGDCLVHLSWRQCSWSCRCYTASCPGPRSRPTEFPMPGWLLGRLGYVAVVRYCSSKCIGKGKTTVPSTSCQRSEELGSRKSWPSKRQQPSRSQSNVVRAPLRNRRRSGSPVTKMLSSEMSWAGNPLSRTCGPRVPQPH